MMALDAARSWFRYHHLFADLLQLELRRTARMRSPRCTGPPRSGSRAHGYPVEAIRHAQARRTGGWPPGCWPTTGPACSWTGRPRPCMRSSPGSPPRPAAADAELAALVAADELAQGSLRRRSGT